MHANSLQRYTSIKPNCQIYTTLRTSSKLSRKSNRPQRRWRRRRRRRGYGHCPSQGSHHSRTNALCDDADMLLTTANTCLTVSRTINRDDDSFLVRSLGPRGATHNRSRNRNRRYKRQERCFLARLFRCYADVILWFDFSRMQLQFQRYVCHGALYEAMKWRPITITVALAAGAMIRTD